LPGKKNRNTTSIFLCGADNNRATAGLRNSAYRLGLLNTSLVFWFYLCVMANPLRSPLNLLIPLIN
jgi:hypothetical protein